MILFTLNRKEIDSGQFPLWHLEEFSKKTGAKIFIKDLGVIENGCLKVDHPKDKLLDDLFLTQISKKKRVYLNLDYFADSYKSHFKEYYKTFKKLGVNFF